VLLVAACAPAPPQASDQASDRALVAACKENDGLTQSQCECVLSELRNRLDKDVYRIAVLNATDRGEEGAKLFEALEPEKKVAVTQTVSAAYVKCEPAQ
jgi:hypothetical protein